MHQTPALGPPSPRPSALSHIPSRARPSPRRQLRETAEAAAQEAALKLGLEFDEAEEKAEAERLADDAVLASAEAAALRAFEIKRQMEARKLEKADLRLARVRC